MNESSHTDSAADRRELHEQATRWLLRLEAGDCSDQERSQLASWLAEDENHRLALDEMAVLWGQLGVVAEYHRSRQVAIRRERNVLLRLRRRYNVVAAAAVVVLVVLSYPFLALRLHADYVTAAGQAKRIELTDGTVVDLNTASAIRVHYTDTSREVELIQGEAFFRVSPNKKRPFSVIAGSAQATAVGTEYLVRYEDDKSSVIVTEGCVEVKKRGDADSARAAVDVGAGETLDFTDALSPDLIKTADINSVTAWLRGKVIFDGERLEQVVAELNRYHAGRIIVIGDGFKQRRVTGIFSTTEPVHIIQSIAAGLNLRVTRLTDYLIVLHSS